MGIDTPYTWDTVLETTWELLGGKMENHQYSTVQYSTVQYSTVQYSTVQYSAVQ